MGVSSYGFSELSADEHESVLLVVTPLVKGGSSEVVFGCSKDPLNFDGVVECLEEELCLLHPQFVGVFICCFVEDCRVCQEEDVLQFLQFLYLLQFLLLGEGLADLFLECLDLLEECREGALVLLDEGVEE